MQCTANFVILDKIFQSFLRFILRTKTGVMKTRLYLSLIVFACFFISAKTSNKKILFKSDALKDFVEIPIGKAMIGQTEFHVEEFYISKYEITNQQYQKFLNSIEEDETLTKAKIKSENWQKINALDKIVEKYHDYPGFSEFPVVNISYEGAKSYCQWLTKKINDEEASRYTVEIRLPTREEWIRAARGETNQIYAWHPPYLANEKGRYLCNFKKLGVEAIHYNPDKKDYEIIKLYDGPDFTLTTKVGEYDANKFGVYDMCGNAAEMIDEEGIAVGGSYNSPGYDVRVESEEKYHDASPLVGFRPVLIIRSN